MNSVIFALLIPRSTKNTYKSPPTRKIIPTLLLLLLMLALAILIFLATYQVS